MLTSFLLFTGFVAVVVNLVLLVVKAFAFVNSLLHSAEEYRAAGKWTKQAWNILLGIALLLQVFPLLGGIISLAFTIAALVYLADVRPAMKALYRRR